MPAADEAPARAPRRRATPCSSSQSPSSSSRSDSSSAVSSRRRRHAAAPPPPARRRAARAAAGRSRSCASIASLCRMPGDPRRAARRWPATAAAAGLFSSWVSPAVSVPRASSCWRWPTICCELRMPEEQALEQVHRHREPGRAPRRRSPRRRARRTGTSVIAAHRGGVRLRLARRRCRPASRRRRRRRWSVRTVSTSSGPTRRLIAIVPSSSTMKQLGRLALVDDDVVPAGHARRPSRARHSQSSCSSSSVSNRKSPRSSSWVSRSAVGLGGQCSWRSQVAVHEGDGHRALADGGRDPLDRVGPDVAGDEDARACSPPAATGRGRAASRAAVGRRRPGPGR